MIQRAAAAVAVIAGIALIVVTFSLSLFGRAYAGERVADNFGPVMSPQGIVQQEQGLTMTANFVAGYDKASAAFAHELGLSPTAYQRFVAANYPAVAFGDKEIPVAATTVVAPVVAEAPKIEDKWQAVTHVPGLGLPIAGAPWLLLLLGVTLLVLGGLALFRPRRPTTIAILVLGVAMIVGPLALSLPEKTSASTAVLKVGRVAVSQKAATAAHRTALAVDAMVSQMKANMLPDLAPRLHTSLARLDVRIIREFPGLATGLREWPAIAPAAFTLTAAQQASVEDFKKVDGIGYTGLSWLAIGPGIALLLLAGGALWVERRREPQPAA